MVASGPSSNYDEADFNHGLLESVIEFDLHEFSTIGRTAVVGAATPNKVQSDAVHCRLTWRSHYASLKVRSHRIASVSSVNICVGDNGRFKPMKKFAITRETGESIRRAVAL